MRRRNIEMRRIRQGIGSDAMNNIIEAHQDAASKADEGGLRFEKMQSRLKSFNKQLKKQSKSSSHNFEWLKEQKHLEKEAKLAIKGISTSLSSLFSFLHKEYEDSKRACATGLHSHTHSIGGNLAETKGKNCDAMSLPKANKDVNDTDEEIFPTEREEMCALREDE
eukprot:12826337-Ditylum_brightwellii.AAC.1